MSPAVSSRWCPTPEQLMILEEMYRNGIRTPNASQIQKITSHLSLYGKIEGKNVFYWFQNHKARDRLKMRRKLTKQIQHHQEQEAIMFHHQGLQYFHHPLPPPPPTFGLPSSAFQHFPHYTSPTFLPQVGVEEIGTGQVINYTWRIDGNEKATYGSDCMMMTDHVGPTLQCCSGGAAVRPPLKTLQLFPITASNFKQESNASVNSSVTFPL